MTRFRLGIVVIILTIIIPVSAIAETGDSAEQSAAAEGFTVSIDLRAGAAAVGIIPGFPVLIGVPMSISRETATITPQFGFMYFLDVMTDLHNPYYVPIGLAVSYNPLQLGADLMYYAPVGGTNTNHMFSTMAASELTIVESGRFYLNLELKLGPMFIFEPERTRVFVMLSSSFIPGFKL